MNGAPITISGITGSSITSPVNLVQQSGSAINVSGGYMTYAPGFVQVSRLIDANGLIVSASNANPNDDYVGICCSFTVNHNVQGQLNSAVTQIYSSPLMSSGYYSPGYIQGGAGGSLTLNVAAAVLDGQVYSAVVTGIKQRTPETAPAGASLTMNSSNPAPFDPNALVVGSDYNTDQITLSDTAANTAAQWAAGFNLAVDGNGTETPLNSLLPINAAGTTKSVYMPASWINSGFVSVNLGANAHISLAAGNNITLPAGGSFTAKADKVDMESSIIVPGGIIDLPGAFTVTSVGEMQQNPNSSYSISSGNLTIGPGITLSTAGTWTNDVGARSLALAPIVSNGGTIALGAYGDIDVGLGSVLDVSAGAYESATSKITMGSAGALTLTAGLAPPTKATDYDAGQAYFPNVADGVIHFAGGLKPGQLRGYGGDNGGTLTLASYGVATITPASQMSGALILEGPQATDALGNAYTPLAVSTDFFSAGGFSSISLTAAGISLPASVTLTPTVIASGRKSAGGLGRVACRHRRNCAASCRRASARLDQLGSRG